MAKILGKTHSPYVPDADTHTLNIRENMSTVKIISMLSHRDRCTENANFNIRKMPIFKNTRKFIHAKIYTFTLSPDQPTELITFDHSYFGQVYKFKAIHSYMALSQRHDLFFIE